MVTSSGTMGSVSAACTVTAQVADFSPAWAVIVAVPAETAVTVPLSTVATAASLVVQVTVLSVALSGSTVAVSVSEPPTVSVSSVLSRLMPVTEISGCAAASATTVKSSNHARSVPSAEELSFAKAKVKV